MARDNNSNNWTNRARHPHTPRRRAGGGQGGRGGAGLGTLTPAQRGAIAATASKAYRAQSDLDLVDGLSFDDWRRIEAVCACGKTISQANQRDFLKLQAHFFDLAGDKRGFVRNVAKANAKADRPTTETPERAGQLRHQIAQALGAHHLAMVAQGREEEEIGWSYVHSIAQAKHKTPLAELDATQAEQMLCTIVNRINAKEGKGQTTNRNKKQRSSGTKNPADPPKQS